MGARDRHQKVQGKASAGGKRLEVWGPARRKLQGTPTSLKLKRKTVMYLPISAHASG